MLTPLSENISVFDLGATVVGVIRQPDGYILTDSGLESGHAKKIADALDGMVTAVYHTHTHADHTGGSLWLSGRHKSEIYAPAGELSFMYMTELEGGLLNGGSSPEAARKPFLMAPSVAAKPLPRHAFAIGDMIVTPVSTPGHSPDHTAFITDDIAFLGDCLSAPEIISKHGILYLYDPGKAYETLNMLGILNFSKAVICHKGVLEREEFDRYITAQKNHIENIERLIYEYADDNSAEDITRLLMEKLKMRASLELWLLALSTIKGYLSSMERKKLLHTVFEKDIRWKTA